MKFFAVVAVLLVARKLYLVTNPIPRVSKKSSGLAFPLAFSLLSPYADVTLQSITEQGCQILPLEFFPNTPDNNHTALSISQQTIKKEKRKKEKNHNQATKIPGRTWQAPIIWVMSSTAMGVRSAPIWVWHRRSQTSAGKMLCLGWGWIPQFHSLCCAGDQTGSSWWCHVAFKIHGSALKIPTWTQVTSLQAHLQVEYSH